jgi:hypothetical protein
MQRFVIGNAEQHAISAEVFDKIHLLNDFARVRTGYADKKRNAFFNRLDSGNGQGFEFVKQQVIAFAIGSGGGDVVNAVFDNLIDGFF